MPVSTISTGVTTWHAAELAFPIHSNPSQGSEITTIYFLAFTFIPQLINWFNTFKYVFIVHTGGCSECHSSFLWSVHIHVKHFLIQVHINQKRDKNALWGGT